MTPSIAAPGGSKRSDATALTTSFTVQLYSIIPREFEVPTPHPLDPNLSPNFHCLLYVLGLCLILCFVLDLRMPTRQETRLVLNFRLGLSDLSLDLSLGLKDKRKEMPLMVCKLTS